MNKREKKLFFVILILLAVIMFMSNSFRKKNDIIDFNNNIINRYKNDIKSYNIKIDSLNSELLAKKQVDTLIIIKYKQKIDSIYVYKHDDYISFYDTLLHTNLLKSDTFICFDSINIQKLTTKIVKCERDSELLANCNDKINNYDSIISYKDSLLANKNNEIANINEANSLKIKKLRKQRNSFVATALVELAVIIGLITK